MGHGTEADKQTMRISLTIAATLCCCVNVFAQTQAIRSPAGYRMPTETDFTGDWKENRFRTPTSKSHHYHLTWMSDCPAAQRNSDFRFGVVVGYAPPLTRP